MVFGEQLFTGGGSKSKTSRFVEGGVLIVVVIILIVINLWISRSGTYDEWWGKILFYLIVIIGVVLGIKAAYEIFRGFV